MHSLNAIRIPNEASLDGNAIRESTSAHAVDNADAFCVSSAQG